LDGGVGNIVAATSPFLLVKNGNIWHYGAMMIKKLTVTLLSIFILFSCGELPELKPLDWSGRLTFSRKPYTGDLFDAWDAVTRETMAGITSNEVQQIRKFQRWKGSGTFQSGQQPFFYYILHMENSVTITIDWRYRKNESIDFNYKGVGDSVTGYDFSTEQILMAQNEYLVIRISLPAEMADGSDMDWELGFTVK
jgi:hypothetical protein